ncbi:hypothetical protein NE236_36795 [Actinoallomurus purpureus]|uniref:hypothetical protein n=1 Tax=Actinoallomurus purpureus TaxID=478114 RepID=UPI002092E615|nr:hypothetical protein [Actinoallomurus purpureus]MCO6010531.1 hypothetical protein [Actinoallomurus purpureus]
MARRGGDDEDWGRHSPDLPQQAANLKGGVANGDVTLNGAVSSLATANGISESKAKELIENAD